MFIRGSMALVATMCVLSSGLVHAQVGDRAIPVRELPPFPSISDEADTVRDVTVVSAQLAEEDRVVGAAKREQSLGNVASAVTVLTASQMRRFGYRTLAEALASVTGVYMTDDRSIERVGIRGVQLLGDANTRLLVLIDGTPLNEPWSQYVDSSYALPVHIDDVSRIEVIRGPVSSIYGTNAFLGIVNVVTRAADKAPPVYGRTSVDTLASAGGNAGFAMGGVNRQVRGTVSFLRRGGETIDYAGFADAGEDPRTDADGLQSINGSVVATYDRLFFQVRASSRSRELPGAPFDAVVGDDGNKNTDQVVVSEVGYTHEVADELSLTGRLYASAYQYTGDLQYEGEGFRSVGESLWYGAELRSLLDLSAAMPGDGKLDLTTGVAGELAQTSSTSGPRGDDAMSVDIEQDFDIQGIYSELFVAPTPWLGVSAGLRYDRNSLFDDKLNPRVALFLTRGKRYGAKLLYAEGFRNPSIFEAFFEDNRRFLPACSPNCSTNGTTLFPEEIVSYEGVVWVRPTTGTKLRVSGWNWDLTSLIERRRVTDPATLSERLQYQNLARLVSRGVEAEASYRDTTGWFGYTNVAYAEVTRNQIDDPRPPNSPSVVAKLGLSTPAVLGTHLSTDVRFVGSRATRDELVDTDPWVGWNVTLYAPDLSGFDVTLSLRNVLGARQEIPLQADYDRQGDLATITPGTDVLTVPGVGREVFARIGRRL